MLEKSKGIVAYVIKEIAKSLFSGRGVVGISLPVRIFEPRSALERVLDGFSFAPKYLNEACNTKDSVERMKLAIAFVVSGMYMRANQFKPFNPLLGETLEGSFADGSKVYMEHTSHHPPVSNYLIEGPARSNYKLYGCNEFVGNIKNRGNVLNILFRGTNYIEFPDGEIIEFENHVNKVRGLMWGDKLISMEGCLTFTNREEGIKATIIMEPKTQEVSESDDPNYFEGLLYYFNDNKSKNEPDTVSKICDVDSEICSVYGSWLDTLYIDDKKLWQMDNPKPHRINFTKKCLPSDHRYREDLIWLFYKNEPYAQEWKNLLEVQQRKERKNRQTVEKKRKGNVKFIDKF